MVKAIAKLILALNGNVKKTQIAAGFSWGLLLGIIPAGNAFWILLFVVSLLLRHNQGGKLLVMAIMKIIAPAVYPLSDMLGWSILHIESLQPLFTKMYNMPFVPFTNFNNTLVAGGLVAGLLLWLPCFFVIICLIPIYRNTFLPKIINSKLLVTIQQFPFVQKIRKAVETISDIKKLDIL
ncbi:MAG: TIGR03546 family protein [Spirochaetaceae bacterium]|jgi:uncharacterized protein (TIGR03546 family)|nr:TIGR03546 family protein [Spirochaetaceae bacterium]